MDGTPQEITTLVGREVYSNSGVFVGEVEDVQLDIDGVVVSSLAVGKLNNELFGGKIGGTSGVLIPYRWVRSVGDIILINDIVERFRNPESEDEAVA